MDPRVHDRSCDGVGRLNPGGWIDKTCPPERGHGTRLRKAQRAIDNYTYDPQPKTLPSSST